MAKNNQKQHSRPFWYDYGKKKRIPIDNSIAFINDVRKGEGLISDLDRFTKGKSALEVALCRDEIVFPPLALAIYISAMASNDQGLGFVPINGVAISGTAPTITFDHADWTLRVSMSRYIHKDGVPLYDTQEQQSDASFEGSMDGFFYWCKLLTNAGGMFIDEPVQGERPQICLHFDDV